MPFSAPLRLAALLALLAAPLQAAPAAFDRALDVAVAGDEVLSTFYRARGHEALWTGADDSGRRAALLAALDDAPLHGLPVGRYDAAALRAQLAAARTEGDRGRIEAALTRAWLDFARDLSSGAVEPGAIDPTIKREPRRPAPAWLLARAEAADFAAFLADLPPDQPEYARLMAEKLALEAEIAAGFPAPRIEAGALEPGDSGPQVVALRDRLQALGYLGSTATQDYDARLARAVQRFQSDSGLDANGIAGESTLAALNMSAEERLGAVTVALERLRWMGDAPRGARHIWVNQPDFTARIVDEGRVTFVTRVVIGKAGPDTRSPEFSDQMEFMVANPSWSVPRSITTKEYLPLLQKDPTAVAHLQLLDGRGRVVSREGLDFTAFTPGTFPFALRQAPSDDNALGLVKFMFPNAHNIYLHDTPSKSLFRKEVRAYSHGCIRVAAPFDLAEALLAPQSQDPLGTFEAALATGRETQIDLARPVPVHLVYFTAWPDAKGRVTYRRDVYGRDAAILKALVAAGLAQDGVQG